MSLLDFLRLCFPTAAFFLIRNEVKQALYMGIFGIKSSLIDI